MALTRDGQGHFVHEGRLLPSVMLLVGFSYARAMWGIEVLWGLDENEAPKPGESVYRKHWAWFPVTLEWVEDFVPRPVRKVLRA